MFAGLPVRNFGISLEWYRRFLGSSPNFCPNDTEAVWLIAEYRWIYIIVDPKRAGGAIQTVMCSDLEATIAEISKRGIDFSDEERPAEGSVRSFIMTPMEMRLALAAFLRKRNSLPILPGLHGRFGDVLPRYPMARLEDVLISQLRLDT